MKTTDISIPSGIYSRELEEKIQKKDGILKEKARANGKHFALRNLPAPSGDNLPVYTGELKSGYEELVSFIYEYIQPATHISNAQSDTAVAQEKDTQLDGEIKSREDHVINSEHELGNYNPGTIPMRMWIVGIITGLISIGETIYNTMSFQIMGENMLFALMLSVSVSVAVFAFSHVAPFILKSVKTTLHWRIVFWGSLLLALSVFTTLAILRSRYLASHEVRVSPVLFVSINFFFFIVSAALSFFVLPSWAEIRENLTKMKHYHSIRRNKRKLQQLRDEKEERKMILTAKNQQRIGLNNKAGYSVERVGMMYREAVEIFKISNISYRTDRQSPECFQEATAELEIRNPIFHYTSNNTKEK